MGKCGSRDRQSLAMAPEVEMTAGNINNQVLRWKTIPGFWHAMVSGIKPQ